MRALKKILIFHLVMLLLASGLPHFMGEDASRDHRIDLADAVLLVQDFARTAQEPGAFHAQVEKMFSALHVAAGMKTVIQKSENRAAAPGAPGMEMPGLIHPRHFQIDLARAWKIPADQFGFVSFLIAPDPHPPEIVG